MERPDPERNRELIAERLRWPDGALEACRRLETEYPGWRLWYVTGGLPMEPMPGYRATLDRGWRWRNENVFASTPEMMSELIREKTPEKG